MDKKNSVNFVLLQGICILTLAMLHCFCILVVAVLNCFVHFHVFRLSLLNSYKIGSCSGRFMKLTQHIHFNMLIIMHMLLLLWRSICCYGNDFLREIVWNPYFSPFSWLYLPQMVVYYILFVWFCFFICSKWNHG